MSTHVSKMIYLTHFVTLKNILESILDVENIVVRLSDFFSSLADSRCK